jgi:peptidoglycan/LPS O-acetylase OafA/YrhL
VFPAAATGRNFTVMTSISENRRLALLMAFAAATLAIFAALHLAGAIHSADKSADGSGAGIPEAVICLVLLFGAAALVRSPHRGRQSALLSTGFAIVGFVVGLAFTLSGGAPVDLAYHLTMLPILISTGVLLARAQRRRDVHAPSA